MKALTISAAMKSPLNWLSLLSQKLSASVRYESVGHDRRPVLSKGANTVKHFHGPNRWRYSLEEIKALTMFQLFVAGL
jgi:hypothetical protein